MGETTCKGQMGRRQFLAKTATAVTAAITVVRPSAVRGADANGRLELGVIGTGGRGRWIGELFEQHGNAKVVAVHDYFQDRVDGARERFGLDAARCHTGLEGYLKLLEGQVDAVAIESPPYFHADQVQASVEAGKHVYLAKPMAVDVPGCKTILAAGDQAKGRLSFVVDFQTRNHPIFREAARRVHTGAIGAPVLGQCFYHTGRLNPQAKPGSQEARLRNWVFDVALSGDIIVEQNIHVIDVACWLLDAAPRHAVGTGGRKVRTDVGDCWDHFVVTYGYPNGVTIDFSSSQFLKGFHDMCVRVYGSGGTIETHYDGDVWIRGDDSWEGGSTQGIYLDGAVNNIRDFRRSIDTGNTLNNVAESIRSNLAAILGRMAAYEGRIIYWDEMMASAERLDPKLVGLG